MDPWVPLRCPALVAGATTAATIDVQCASSPAPSLPGAPATLRLGTVEARVDDDRARVSLIGPSGVHGTVDLEERRAKIRSPDPTPEVAADLYSMLTIASAFLLGRLRRVLLHAAAVVPPAGDAWLLVGDARAGKTTTSLNLVTIGWDYCSDDQVVLSLEGDQSLAVEGWLRPFHVDAGWRAGRTSETRESVEPSSVGPGGWQRRAALAGAVFLDLQPDSPTEVARLGKADALAAIVRQTPWLMADPVQAPAILALLIAAIQQPTVRLRLGRDTYRDAARLLVCLQPIVGAA